MIDRSDTLWYKNAIIYELHIKAFFDSNNDGNGDFAGLIKKLDYIADLGVTAVWLLPFYPSPLRDDGYDIANYTAINPTYGVMRDFRQFVAAAHARGIRVITELVVNHTSDQHPWFQRARHAKPSSRWRDYYVWSDTDQRYLGTRVIFLDTETSNWTWDPVAKSYFWHRFYSHQPDLNYDNPRVMVEMLRIMRFWLDIGVDGLRLDAVPYLVEREGTSNENLPQTHALLKRFRAELEQRYPDRMLLAEANQWPEDTRPYFGNGDECHMAFHFPLMPRIYMSLAREDRYPITDIINQTPTIPDNAQWAIFLRNHDELTLEMVTDTERDYLWQTYATDMRARLNLGIRRRLAPLLDNDRRKIELLNGLLLSMPGTPVLYYGDELGMGDNFYLGDRDGVRTPMQWSADRNGGFSRADPQRLFLPPIMDPIYGYEAVNVEAQEENPNSLLNWTKRTIAVRKSHLAFGQGTLTFLYPSNRKILAYLREFDGETILCVFNLSRSAQAVELDLADRKGLVPIELTGRSVFPAIGTLPYLLTLPAYGFYWFSLTDPATIVVSVEPVPEPLPELETLVLSHGWSLVDSHWSDPKRQDRFLRALLPSYVHNQRWFDAKDSKILRAMPFRFGELRRAADTESFLLLTLDLELSEGAPQRYFFPLAMEWGEHNLAADNPALPYVLAKVRRGSKAGVVQEASAAPDFAHTLLNAMARNETLESENGQIRFQGSQQLIELSIDPDAPKRHLSGEQDATSIAIGRTALVRLYRRLHVGIEPEIEMGRYLTKAGFDKVPALLGSAEFLDKKGQTTALAAAFSYIHNQGDGWTVVVNALDRELEEASLTGTADADSPGLPYSLSLVRIIGRRTAELHRVLAAERIDPNFAPEPVTKSDLDQWIGTLHNRAHHVFELLTRIDDSLEGHARETVDQLLGLRKSLLTRLQALLPKGSHSEKIRLHNNYHLGQILVAEEDIYIVNFQGEPAKSLGYRRAKAPPARDIASMLRSFDYAANMVIDRQRQKGVGQPEEIEARAQHWREAATRIFLDAYTVVLTKSGETALDASAQELLPFFLADKLLYEITYEAMHRPPWLWVPAKAALELIGEPEG